jgi:hypothetical protein
VSKEMARAVALQAAWRSLGRCLVRLISAYGMQPHTG